MKYLLGLLLLICTAVHAQIPKNANAIEVKGVSFKEVVNRLLDSNFSIAKIDSNFQTVETAPRYVYKNSYPLKLIIKARVKDSIATIQGVYGNDNKDDFKDGSFSRMMAGVDNAIGNYPIWQHKKKPTPFTVMNNLALSFNKPVAYKQL